MDKDGKKNEKPVIQIFGNVDEKNADLAEAKAAAAAIAQVALRYCAPDESNSAGFPQGSSTSFSEAILPASAIGSERGFQEQKGKGKNLRKVASQNLQRVASRNLRKVASQNLRKVAKMRRVAKMRKMARMRQRENSKVNSKERRETKGNRVQKDLHSLFPKLPVRSVHASPKSLVISRILAGGIPGFRIELCCFPHPLNWPMVFLWRVLFFVYCMGQRHHGTQDVILHAPR